MHLLAIMFKVVDHCFTKLSSYCILCTLFSLLNCLFQNSSSSNGSLAQSIFMTTCALSFRHLETLTVLWITLIYVLPKYHIAFPVSWALQVYLLICQLSWFCLSLSWIALILKEKTTLTFLSLESSRYILKRSLGVMSKMFIKWGWHLSSWWDSKFQKMNYIRNVCWHNEWMSE